MLYKSQNPHGGDVYSNQIRLDFSSNINPFGVPESVKDAVKNSVSGIHHYPDPYCRQLVRAISGHEGLPEKYIICGNGGAELIYSYCTALSPGKALEPAPTFSEYALGLENAGCMPDYYHLGRDNDFELDSGFADRVKEEKPDVVFVCSPNNPTGRLVSHNLLEELLNICSDCSIRLFVDESFLDLADGISLKDHIPDCRMLFILKAFTKNYAVAGLRLGYALTSDEELLEKMSESVQPWNVSVPAQAAGLAALKEKEFLAESVSFIKDERKWMKDQLEKRGFYVCPSDANYLLFRSEKEIASALRQQRIAVRDCSNYEGLEKGWYRIAVRPHTENEELLKAIDTIYK